MNEGRTVDKENEAGREANDSEGDVDTAHLREIRDGLVQQAQPILGDASGKHGNKAEMVM